MLALNYLFFFIAIFSAWIVLEIFVRLMIQKLSKDASQGKSSKQGETLASSLDPQEEAYRAEKDMLEALSHIRMAVAQAIATEKQLEAQQKKNVELAEAWKNREEMAISQGNKELSDQASRRKNEYSTAALSLGAQLAKVSGAVQKLRDNLTRVENDVARFHAKMDSLKARQGAADASVKFNKHFADLLVLYSANQNKLAEQKMHGILDEMPAGLIVVNSEAEILAVNPQIEKLTGTKADSICHKISANTIFKLSTEESFSTRLETLANGGIYSTSILTSNEEWTPTDVTISKIQSGDYIICVLDSRERAVL